MKIKLPFLVLIICVMLSACSKPSKEDEQNNTPTNQPTLAPTETPTQQPTLVPTDTPTKELSIEDYYPFEADSEYVYEGKGSEFAFYNRYVDFLDEEHNRMQIRTNNGGTETVRVLELTENSLSIIKSTGESYSRENIMLDAAAGEDAEILLKEPLEKGTEWTLPDGRKRYISNVDVTITTPLGTYTALEVTTEAVDSISKDFYAPQVGLVMSEFMTGDDVVSSQLSSLKKDSPLGQIISVYYVDQDEKIHIENKEVSFFTNDGTLLKLQEVLSNKPVKDTYLPLISPSTQLLSVARTEDSAIAVDFTNELVTEMNAGAGFETLILQCIVNTLGQYYGVNQVYITVEGKPYESGHILMKEGEPFLVNLDQVVE
ncbi:MAG: GerMN domain-containing protein [Mobilitalea sp.]